MPPNGVASDDASNVLTHTVPARRRRATRPAVAHVGGPDRRREPVAGLVGQRHRVLGAVGALDREHRAEHLLAGRSASARSARLDHRRLHVRATGAPARPRAPPESMPRAVGRRRARRAPARRRGARSLISAPSTVSGAIGSRGREARGERRQPLDQLVAHVPRRPPRASRRGRSGRRCRRSPSRSPRRLRRGPRRRRAPPAGSCRRARATPPCRWTRRRSAGNSRPTGTEPVNAILSTSGWRPSACAGLLAVAGHDVEHAVGDAGLGRELGQRQRAQRRLLRGLEHHRVAGGQRRRELPRGDDQRVVPRHDRADDAQRLASDQGERVGAGGRDLAVDLVDRLGRTRRSSARRWGRRRRGRRRSDGRCRRLELRQLLGVLVISSARRSSTRPRCAGSASAQSPRSNARRAAATARSMSSARRRGRPGRSRCHRAARRWRTSRRRPPVRTRRR